MHRRVPSGRHEYHIVVAAFGAATSERVSDAAVTGELSELGLAGIRKALEPMTIAQTITYGGYFDLPDHDIYTVKLAEMGPGLIRLKAWRRFSRKSSELSHQLCERAEDEGRYFVQVNNEQLRMGQS